MHYPHIFCRGQRCKRISALGRGYMTLSTDGAFKLRRCCIGYCRDDGVRFTVLLI
ncbi:hypothetical protein HBH56_144240 [Parastagonospora nodorum]|uniref:Uncharacterized protein n=1 Tax=Phaeosphaeria nodorum (strain SN15 / ATCC MYA-4574 / FGSC 10173) TaxID=321614 RepID=A0A7U2FEG1_PHANO|nr:hypothetical protein HBH56_144240 [Parastagonospora nodorum]QRD01421.1 hypothetical protein JI435_120880 [Parastagonospora nodorum SN15]KAH3927860.1 hypothetical protein HBH54_149430 [Parastagonospora nodorum]KAH3947928.1 hypothetical protein HBH53_109470 [Parastagonospora nodorum]KAH3960188.1 hypothetical protein HBH51_193290 [Parastagonospora nodorum]